MEWENSDTTNEDTMEDMYLVFTIKNKDYGIEIKYLLEITALQEITEIVNMPTYIKGVINLRGKIIPMIDVRIRMGIEAIDYHERTCIVIVTISAITVGLIVDSVKEVVKIPKESIDFAPDFGNETNDRFVKQIGKTADNLRLLLDLEKLVKEKDIADIPKEAFRK